MVQTSVKTLCTAVAALLAAMLLLLPAAGATRNRCPATLSGDAELRERYANADSRWMNFNCEAIHYVDQGRGPAVLLFHGSYASLRQWDVWAQNLSRHYRVVRLDFSPAGLSGPHPTNDYSVARRIQIVDALLGRLRIDRALVVGTSSGGVPAAAYAAERPRRVTGIILNNIAARPIARDPSHYSEELKAALAEDARHPGYHLTGFWRAVLRANVRDPDRVTPELAQEWTDLNNRALRMPGATAAAARDSKLERTVSDLPRIAVPTLLLWSADDHEVSIEDHGQRALALSGAKDKQLLAVANCGHIMPLECAGEALAQALPFIRRVAR